MTLNDLKKIIPEEYHDKLIEIYVTSIRPGEEGTYPLIQVEVDQIGLEEPTVILTPDVS